MATHSSILTWRIPWTEESGGYSPWGRKESDMTEPLHFLHFPIHLPMQETRALFLGQEDPLEEGMATHSSILTWEIP